MLDEQVGAVAMTDELRALWAFDDLVGTEHRLRAALAAEPSAERQAELLTQLARAAGLRGEASDADALLDEAAACDASARVQVRVALERGRVRRTGGDAAAALPLFEHAYRGACDARLWFLAGDAAHMAAIAAPDDASFTEWTRRGLEVADEHDEAAYWIGPLCNNLGWRLDANGQLEQALAAFSRALDARERDHGDPQAIAVAQYAVGRSLRRLGRAAEAVPLLEQAVAWADGTGAPDGWFHEELSEEYAAVGRSGEARRHAEMALSLLPAADPAFAGDGERRGRLEALAAPQGPRRG